MVTRQTSTRRGLFTASLMLILLLGQVVHARAGQSDDWAQRVAQLIGSAVSVEEVTIAASDSGTFYEDGSGPGVPILSGLASAGHSGGYVWAVVLGETPIVSAWQEAGGGAEVHTWRLAAPVPTSEVDAYYAHENAEADVTGCDLAVGIIGGIVGGGGCYLVGGPVSVALLCGGVVGGAGTYLGDWLCPGDIRERVSARLECDVRFCDIHGEILSFSLVNDIDITTFWDRDPEPGVVGPVACRPACGVHSITEDRGIRPSFVGSVPFVDQDTATVKTLYTYQFSARLDGAPACFVDFTKTVWTFVNVDRYSEPTMRLDKPSPKPWEYCPY